jgi:uncharacterized RDD family membrane protein YckC
MSGLTTNGVTNRTTDGEFAVLPLLCPSDVVGSANEASASSQPCVSQPCVSEPCVSEAGVYAGGDSWRVEVAARLERYRTRRKPRTPRYPSLLLPFDSPSSWSRSVAESKTGSTEAGSANALARADLDFTFETEEQRTALAEPGFSRTAFDEPSPAEAAFAGVGSTLEQSAKVIEFPRSAAIPVFVPSDLADPVVDRGRPRIVEVPEILPAPPALGGMLIEAAQREPVDRLADHPTTFPSASIVRRGLAALVDGAILVTALTAFAAIFLRLNPDRGPLPLLGAALIAVAVVLWAAYAFLFVVYTGSTPGLRAARLRLAGWDGSALNRRARRWRVLASYLSAFSAGLGYLWCVLDQDELCWHDRIARTHVQAVDREE